MRDLKKYLGGMILVVGLMMFSAGPAQGASFTMSIDNAILDLGSLHGVRAIDSELDPPDPPATLAGDLTGDTVSIPKAGFVFPEKNAEVSPGINAAINMEANDDITGTYDAGTGKLLLDVSLKASVGVLGSTCVISPIVLQLSSENKNPYLGQAFDDGIDGVGVIGANWAGLPPVTGGGSCGIVSGLIAGPGGIAMSHGVHAFQTCETEPSNPICGVVNPPQKKPVLNSAPPSSTDQTTASFTYAKGNGESEPVDGFECVLDGGAPEPCGTGESGSKEYTGLAVGAHTFTVKATNSAGSGPETTQSWTVTSKAVCPEGTTGTPPDCQATPKKAQLAALKVSPKTKAVKRGKKAVVTVTVRNTGTANATGVKVCVTAPKRLVQVRKCVTLGQVAAGKARSVAFKIKAKRKKGKAVLKFKATSRNGGAKNGKATIRVR